MDSDTLSPDTKPVDTIRRMEKGAVMNATLTGIGAPPKRRKFGVVRLVLVGIGVAAAAVGAFMVLN